ncbi:PucR family transcriptional regulator [Sinosporangium siamense]|uniref:PucR family transcriptional regulator n=1 Tax=Sinosporangium siamense TaxID=1367973 RepID=A0A919RME6_9ACTN|nr:PucR family transcriptional regulator [Sinosporangium siamense]GII95099.1 PucR family transcriptional regulator [Sinosporangium siamense]
MELNDPKVFVTLVPAPGRLSYGTAASGVAIHDPLDPHPPRPAAVVLLTGVDPRSPEAPAVVAGLTGCAVVVVRHCPAPPDALLTAAARAGVALIAPREPLPWSQVHTMMVRAARDHGPGSENAAEALAGVAPGDLPALADAVATAVRRPVMIVDTRWRLLAYSAVPGQWIDDLQREVIMARSVPERDAPPATRTLLLVGDRALRFSTGEDTQNDTADDTDVPRIGAGIRVGETPLGMLWVLEGREPLPDAALPLVEDLARLAGPHLARHEAVRTAERERRGELAGQAIDGGPGTEAACRALGVDLAAGVAVAVVRLTHPASPVRLRALLDGVTAYIGARRRGAACVLRGDTVYCLVPVPDQAAADALREAAGGLVEALRDTVACVGDRTADAAGLAVSRRRAELALAVLREGERVVSVADVRARVAARELDELLAAAPHLLVHGLGELQGFEDAVLAWIEHLGDARTAADLAGLHPHSLRYRIRRLAARGLDLHDPDTRLLAWSTLRLVRHARERPAEMQETRPAAGVADEGH